ncbi:M3 family oligoendopeptidase [Alkalibacterium sp.]|nr:MAG: M3 family oligoendopeptidase [Alkalibacterium sp.]
MSTQLTWNMDSVFKGGSESEELQAFIGKIDEDISHAKELISDWNAENPDASRLNQFLDKREKAYDGLSEASTFARGLHSANVEDAAAAKVVNQLSHTGSRMSEVETLFMKKLKQVEDSKWETLLEDDQLVKSAFNLSEKRDQGKKLLSEKEEKIIQQLSLDGLEGMNNIYQSLVNSVRIPYEENGEVTTLSAGQAANKLTGHKDPKVRSKMLTVWEEAWRAKAPLFADTLNHLAGFRLQTYKLRGEDDFLNPPLEYNRLKKETLDTMWNTITENKPALVKFMNRKAQLMNKEKLGWSDIAAPLSLGSYEPKTYSFEEAQTFITDNFATFSNEMKELAETAFAENWVEAEDREGKRPGAYCANLPVSKQSRVFMTFSGTANNVSTLAHELGHAYHSHVMRDLPQLNRRYAMNVAETASTLSEMVISSATVDAAESIEEKIDLLDSKLSRSAVMFMNIHSRFLFEQRFYEKRQDGLVNEKELRSLMEEAQKEAFQNSLESYHPMFWASKLHFYITGVPFYNFPYTFGFLFSLGIYSYAKSQGESFETDYRNLLRDTASMSTEDLADKHLNVDLTQKDFWQSAIDEILSDVEEYMSLTEDFVE